MPITSNQPWSTRQVGNETIILDREGNAIGFFHSWQDAEFVINLHSEIETLIATNEKLESEIEKLTVEELFK